jgi:hypothetical protein
MLTLLLGASFVAACDSTPTSPDARRIKAEAKPSDIIGFGPSWHATKLPFMPYAINDAGVVVGTQASAGTFQGVIYQNGVTTAMGVSSWGRCQGNVSATAISSTGIVAGIGGDCVLMWLVPGADPFELLVGTTPGLKFTVLAVYDNWTVLGGGTNSSGSFAYQWSETAGESFSPYGFFATATDGQGNVYGHTLDGQPAKWSARYGLARMSVPYPLNGGAVIAADSRGDALAILHDRIGSEPVLYSANSLVSVVTGMPANVSRLNSSGRFVGFAQQVAGQQAKVWTSIQGTVTWLASPDSLPYQTIGVNGCGSIIAAAGLGPLSGALYTRSSPITVVCDQAPVAAGGLISQ